MANGKVGQPRADPNETQIKAEWVAADLDPVFTDHAQLVHAGDLFFVTFAQTRLPTLGVGQGIPQAEIRPVVRLVMSEAAFARFAELFKRQLDLPKRETR